jgi:hypothetical protein
MFAIETGDFNGDGSADILLGGNQYRVKPELGRYDASYGVFLAGDGRGGFRAEGSSTGWMIDGEVRDIITIRRGDETTMVVSRSNAAVVTLSVVR